MSSNSQTVKFRMEAIKRACKDLRELVYSAPSQWLWDSTGSTISIDQIAEAIEKVESDVQNVQQYCDDKYKEVTGMLLAMMWSGLQTKNYEAILASAKQLMNIKIDFRNEPFTFQSE